MSAPPKPPTPTFPSGRDDPGLMNRISFKKKLNVTEILP